MDKLIKPKTAKGKRILLNQEPKLVEDTKNVIFIRGSKSNLTTTHFMKDICLLKNPNTVFLSRKNDWKPFEDSLNIEFVCKKNDCALFMFASHSKKRPNNIIMGCVYDYQILDMFEVGIENFKSLADFKNNKISTQCKPVLIFTGDQFEEEYEYRRIKTFLIDFFVGPKTNAVALNGLEHCIQFIAFESKIYFRSYRINLKKTGTKYFKVDLEEIGPHFEMTLRRTKLASDDLYKKSLKQPTQSKPKRVKNVNISNLGTKLGRIHMNRQDYQRLQTKKMKGLKKSVFENKFKMNIAKNKKAKVEEKMEVDTNVNESEDEMKNIKRSKKRYFNANKKAKKR